MSWKVKATDSNSNFTETSRTLFVDKTNPKVEFTQINDLSTSEESKPTSEVSQPEIDKPDADGNITIPVEPSALEKATSVIPNLIGNLYKSGTAWIPAFAGMTKEGINKIASPLRGLAMTNTIGTGYNNLANNAPGVTKNILLAVGNGFSTTGNFIGSTIAQGFNKTKNATGNGTANIAFTIGEKTDDVSHEFGTAIIKIGYLFVPEPTRISNVVVAKATPNSIHTFTTPAK